MEPMYIDDNYNTTRDCRVYNKNLAPTLTCTFRLKVMENDRNVVSRIAGMRGRNPEDPSDRNKKPVEKKWEQRLEPKTEKICGTLTTVQKDNYVIESDKELLIPGNSNGEPPTEESIRVRKLIPKECWRLMGFTDEDFDKASQVNGDIALWRQAGNSIAVPVLEALFSQLGIEGVQKWNDVHPNY